MQVEALVAESEGFLRWASEWLAGRPALDLAAELGNPGRVAMMAVDLVRGFTTLGPLADPRVAAVVPPAVTLFVRAYTLGVRHYVLIQDAHRPDAEEFADFGRHTQQGTPEAETVPELTTLPFAERFVLLRKNSLSAAIGTGLDDWLQGHPEVNFFLVVGDSTDLCVYQLAMHLRLTSSAFGLGYRVVVPANCVQSYDLPLERAEAAGVMPHPAAMLHHVFLYHMALCGVEVVSEVR